MNFSKQGVLRLLRCVSCVREHEPFNSNFFGPKLRTLLPYHSFLQQHYIMCFILSCFKKGTTKKPKHKVKKVSSCSNLTKQ